MLLPCAKRKENVKNYLKIPESNYFGEIGKTNEISQLEIKLRIHFPTTLMLLEERCACSQSQRNMS